MNKFFTEFKEFVSRGNVMDMAVGVIIGGAFTGIVTSLTDNIINPLITFLTGGGTEISGLVVPGTKIDFGAFISSVINFLIVALIVFILVKSVNRLSEATAKLTHAQEQEEEAAAPVCPHCLEEVKAGATRCPHCGGEIPGGARAKA
ncbi:large conductance mechanosensitive channel protein MscL [Parafannyhessea umbonata]|jgi:large conductance mechanosensitive channel|uniref:large conductance mechanosensitive channel protein MscL n=1 Tax=Parafannyhessea umbonata TaxID=604330 RepID=UPI0015665C3F|nr:large conductance mechanosensitive channel protein MscL [Parafannyhessea umbonata]